MIIQISFSSYRSHETFSNPIVFERNAAYVVFTESQNVRTTKLVPSDNNDPVAISTLNDSASLLSFQNRINKTIFERLKTFVEVISILAFNLTTVRVHNVLRPFILDVHEFCFASFKYLYPR